MSGLGSTEVILLPGTKVITLVLSVLSKYSLSTSPSTVSFGPHSVPCGSVVIPNFDLIFYFMGFFILEGLQRIEK